MRLGEGRQACVYDSEGLKSLFPARTPQLRGRNYLNHRAHRGHEEFMVKARYIGLSNNEIVISA
ncbi:MAG: hypothetical protein Kow00111_26550 [Thermincola ferriacetica]